MCNSQNLVKNSIIIAGGTGLIGRSLVHYFKNKYQIIIIGRNVGKVKKIYGEYITGYNWSEWQRDGDSIAKTSVCIINLAGCNIGDRYWTTSRKKEIINSRVSATKMIVEVCCRLGENAPHLINASAIGIYGAYSGNSTSFIESNKIKEVDYLSKVVYQWENATLDAEKSGVKTSRLRLGVVLSLDGGILRKLKLLYMLNLGGRIGSGNQIISWISITDVILAIDYIINKNILGSINIVAPNYITQYEFAIKYSKFLKKMTLGYYPKWIIKLILGQMGDLLLLKGQKVLPTRLLKENYRFQHANIDDFFSNQV